MTIARTAAIALLAGAALTLGACATLQRGPVGNAAVPQPAKPVDLNRYAGLWYEIGRYENGFERDCEGVTAQYTFRGSASQHGSEHVAHMMPPHSHSGETAVVVHVAWRGLAYLSYGDVAKANQCVWTKVRRQMPRHLDRVLAKAHARQAPLITSIIVNDANRATGVLEDISLSGFIAGAGRLGITVEDPHEFLRSEQEATFEYAAQHRAL